MKRTILAVAIILTTSVTLMATDFEQYRDQVRQMVHADIDPEWAATFSDEAARILTRERITLRTMALIRASIGRDALPEDPAEAAEAYAKIAKEAEALLRRGENPARIAATVRTQLERRRADTGDMGTVPANRDTPGDVIRSERANDAISAAREKKAGNDNPGQGPK